MALLSPWWLSEKALTAWEIEWMIPRPPELNACAAMYCAYIMPLRASKLWGSYVALRRCWAVSLTAWRAGPRLGAMLSRDTYGSEAWASTSNPHWAVKIGRAHV